MGGEGAVWHCLGTSSVAWGYSGHGVGASGSTYALRLRPLFDPRGALRVVLQPPTPDPRLCLDFHPDRAAGAPPRPPLPQRPAPGPPNLSQWGTAVLLRGRGAVGANPIAGPAIRPLMVGAPPLTPRGFGPEPIRTDRTIGALVDCRRRWSDSHTRNCIAYRKRLTADERVSPQHLDGPSCALYGAAAITCTPQNPRSAVWNCIPSLKGVSHVSQFSRACIACASEPFLLLWS